MKVCDKCRDTITKGQKCFDAELCDKCTKHVKEWLKKPKEKKSLLDLGLDKMYGRNR